MPLHGITDMLDLFYFTGIEDKSDVSKLIHRRLSNHREGERPGGNERRLRDWWGSGWAPCSAGKDLVHGGDYIDVQEVKEITDVRDDDKERPKVI